MVQCLLYENLKSDKNPGDTSTIKGRTYYLNCNGEVGNMLYLTDLDYTENFGHCIAEVEIYGWGEKIILQANEKRTVTLM